MINSHGCFVIALPGEADIPGVHGSSVHPQHSPAGLAIPFNDRRAAVTNKGHPDGALLIEVERLRNPIFPGGKIKGCARFDAVEGGLQGRRVIGHPVADRRRSDPGFDIDPV